MSTRAKRVYKCTSRHCARRLQSNDRSLANAQLNSSGFRARKFCRFAGSELKQSRICSRIFRKRHEDRTEFPHFPREESDQPICLCGEVVKTQLRRFGGLEKDLRGHAAGSECERAQSAAGLPLVQSALRPEDDRHRAAAGHFRQTATSRATSLHGAPGVRSDRKR